MKHLKRPKFSKHGRASWFKFALLLIMSFELPSTVWATGGTLFGGHASYGLLYNDSTYSEQPKNELDIYNNLSQLSFGAFVHLDGVNPGLGFKSEIVSNLNIGASEEFSNPKKEVHRGIIRDVSGSAKGDIEGYFQYGLAFRNFVTYTYRVNKYNYIYGGGGLGILTGYDASRDTPGWKASDDSYFAWVLPITAGYMFRKWKNFLVGSSFALDNVISYNRGVYGGTGLAWSSNFGIGFHWRIEAAYIY